MGNFYTPFKIFHYQQKLDSLPQAVNEIQPPLHIRIKPTNVCNHNCWYCAYRSEDLQLGQDMNVRDAIPETKMLEIIDDIIAMGVQAVTFSGGGEPFCYPHLQKTVEKLIASPVKFAALSNGARIEGGIAELFARHGTWLRVSMDGWDDASYSKYRSVADGEFSRIMRNLEAFQRYGGQCVLGVSYIVDQQNVEQIYPMAQRLKNIGVNSLKIAPCIVSNQGSENNAYHAPVYQKVRNEVERVLADLADDGFEVFDAYHELEEKFKKSYDWCPYLQILPVIGADQQVYSCQDKAYNQNGLLGSIEDVSFRQFWENDKEKFFRIKPSCDCEHHCVANNKNRLVLEYLDADPEHMGFV
jgi:MoaA/NifB/PqqE/SkfB family radical SAM enzyme